MRKRSNPVSVNYRNGLRLLGRVDRFIRDASDLLRQHGEFNNTFFVFYTDNGNHFGQHRLPHGKLQPYEEDINFPLIISGPGIPGGAVRRELVGNHDIAPTLAAMGRSNGSRLRGRPQATSCRSPAGWCRKGSGRARRSSP